MDVRSYLPEAIKDVSVETAMTVGAVGLGMFATAANLFVGDKAEAAAYALLTLFGAYKAGELNTGRLQQRKQQISALLFQPATVGDAEPLKPKLSSRQKIS